MWTAIFAVVIFIAFQSSSAQIPRACADEDSLRELTCCPDTGEGVCGSNANRGECVNLQLPNHRNDTTDVRNNFPHYYIRACQCNGNYAGYDCSRCKFGYYGNDCSQRQVLPRQSVADFSDEDWSRYNSIINQTRTYDSGYVAVLEEAVPGTTNLQTSNLTLYGMFIWLHHYAAKDSLIQARPLDFAHTAPGFNTWHRLLSVWLEWEIQGMLQSMSDSNYHMFRLPYWDWRQELQTTTGLGADDLFVANRLGAIRNDNGRARGHIIVGQGDFNFFLTNNQTTICTFEDVAASPNDPIFILHHNMIDCVFIEWQRRHPDAVYPDNVVTPGHARDGFLVPFFPLYTNAELFASSEEFGYSCNLPGLPPNDSVAITMSMSMVFVVALLAFSFNI